VHVVTDFESSPRRLTLSRPFGDLLMELSIALQKFAIYPDGHPSLEPAAASIVRRCERVLEDRDLVAIGVARYQLIIEGVATDPNQPVLRRLASALNRHHLGAISIRRGITPEEVTAALRQLAVDPALGSAIGLLANDRRPVWPHLRLHPLTFDSLVLMADAPLASDSPRESTSRPAELWIGLARAALATEQSVQPLEPVAMEPVAVARNIEEHSRSEAYDQVIIGYLLQIARELKDSSGAEASALRRRTSRMIATLQPATLRRLLEMGGDMSQRRDFVFDASQGMAVDAVLEIVKAAADVGGQTISHGLVRMLSKLAAHAEAGPEPARPLADASLREQVGQLLSGWQLADPNPDAYRHFLQRLATVNAATSPVERDVAPADDSEPLRVLQIGLEIDSSGPLLERALDRAVSTGPIGPLLDLVEASPTGPGGTAALVLDRLADPATVRQLLIRSPIDFAALDRLLPRLTREGYEVLLDVLADADDRTTRRKLLDRLAQAAIDLGPSIVARLDDERWYVQRNMLVLLHRAGRTPPGFSVQRWLNDAHPQVRQEAVRLQLAVSSDRQDALRIALDDEDWRIVRIGLSALQESCPPALVPHVVRCGQDPQVPEQVRLLAVAVLAHTHEVEALNALIRAVDGGTTLLGRPKLAAKTPIMLAALQALADGWHDAPEAQIRLRLAARSSDPAVRRAAVRRIS
jgi:hypothetical protein